MNAYIYNTDTNTIIAQIKGDDKASIEAKFQEIIESDDEALAYNHEWLITDGDFKVIDVRG